MYLIVCVCSHRYCSSGLVRLVTVRAASCHLDGMAYFGPLVSRLLFRADCLRTIHMIQDRLLRSGFVRRTVSVRAEVLRHPALRLCFQSHPVSCIQTSLDPKRPIMYTLVYRTEPRGLTSSFSKPGNSCPGGYPRRHGSCVRILSTCR